MNHKIFETVPIKAPKRSTFDLSNSYKTTGLLSQLIPVCCMETLPSDKFSINSSFQVRLAPLKQPIMDHLDARIEWFYVPNTLVWENWSSFITQEDQSPTSHVTSVSSFPYINLTSSDTATGTLADYLGCGTVSASTGNKNFNALPFLAYQQIYSDYYRNEKTSTPIPNYAYDTHTMNYTPEKSNLNVVRSRAWSKDVFTTAAYTTIGDSSTIDLELDMDNQTTTLSIGELALLRCAAKWNYAQQLGGSRYQESVLAHYGTLPSDVSTRRAVFIGSSKAIVDVNGVVNQTGANVPGDMAGLATVNGLQPSPFTFECKDHGYIIGIFSVMPHATYVNGCARHLLKSNYDDVAFPEFEGLGEQRIWMAELNNSVASNSSKQPFGYNQRYYEYKQIPDTVHGGLRNLSGDVGAYTMVRNITSTSLNNSFVTPTTSDTAFSRVFASSSAFGSGAYHFIAGIDFDIKANRALSEYSLPLF